MSKNNRKRMNGQTKSRIALAVVLVLTLVCGILGVTGMNLDSRGLYKLLPWLPTTNAENWPASLSLGLDLRGGVYVEYSAAANENTADDVSFDSLVEGTIGIIQHRLDDAGYNEATVQRIGGDGIRVEIPDVQDPSVVLNLIGTTAHLEFRDSNGTVLMDGAMVQTAVGGYDSDQADYVVQFRLTGEGSDIFAKATADNLGKSISIYLDEELLISPTVQSVITGGSGVINGMGSMERAQTIAAQIQSGALPMTLTQQKVDTVAATLGDNALSSSVLAALIGIVLIMAIMIIRYRVNGVVASWALCIYVILLFFLTAIFGVQLTLPGLAGIVLGIGMAVDANVIIYERFNEEVRAGRPLKASVRAGFKNALSAILDANVTTMIAAIVLLVYGTGSIQGFGKTLLLGVVTSMITAVVVTRFLMKNIVNAFNLTPAAFTGVKTAKGDEQ